MIKTKKGFEIRLPDKFFRFDEHKYYVKCKEGCFNIEASMFSDIDKFKSISPKTCPFNDSHKIVSGTYTTNGYGIGALMLTIIILLIIL